jgi:hypothetical protein
MDLQTVLMILAAPFLGAGLGVLAHAVWERLRKKRG